MYCKKCGTQIDDDSEFCKSCGNSINITINEAKEKKQQKTWKKILISIIAIGLIIFIVLLLTETIKRNATKEDISTPHTKLHPEEFKIYITLISNANIENLKLQVSFYDENNSLIAVATKKIKSISKSEEIETEVNIYSITINEALNIRSWEIEVIEGKIPIV